MAIRRHAAKLPPIQFEIISVMGARVCPLFLLQARKTPNGLSSGTASRPRRWGIDNNTAICYTIGIARGIGYRGDTCEPSDKRR